MAGDWIQIQKATASKPEILRIASELKCSVGDAFLLCFRFWCWCDEQLVDGNASGVTTEMLDALMGRPGFCAALVKVDWLRVREGSLEVPHFDRHLSASAKKRGLSGKRQAEFKKRSGNAPVTQKELPEKRREEIKGDTPLDPPRGRFVKPTVAEVAAYCQQRGNGIDAEEFIAHYDANGWRRGKGHVPIKDWKACVITWEKERKNGRANGHPQQPDRRYESDRGRDGF